MKLTNIDYDQLPELIGRKQFCVLVGIGRHVFWKLVQAEQIRVVRFGPRGHPRVPKQVLLRFVRSQADDAREIVRNRPKSSNGKPATLTRGPARVIGRVQ